MQRATRPDPVAAFEAETRADLRQRRWLTLHVLLLAGLCTALCWGLSAGLRALGVHSLLWRPVLAIALTWPLYLGLLALWARWLVSRDETDLGDLPDVADAAVVVVGPWHIAPDDVRTFAEPAGEWPAGVILNRVASDDRPGCKTGSSGVTEMMVMGSVPPGATSRMSSRVNEST